MDPLMIAGMAMGGISQIMGGRAASAAAKAQNKQAHRNWIAANTQKTFSNAREQFNATYQYMQQIKRNEAIGQAAYETQADAQSNLRDATSFQSNQLARESRQISESLKSAILSRGISGNSGSYAAITAAQALSALSNAGQLAKNSRIQADNINKQLKAQLGQQTNNIFMPNIQGYDETPFFGNTNTTGSTIAGVLGSVGGGLVSIGGAMGSPSPSGGGGGYADGSGTRIGRPD